MTRVNRPSSSKSITLRTIETIGTDIAGDGIPASRYRASLRQPERQQS
ncbi:MAG: hypothetical protein P4M00_25400 [Azospirillaceae bacterium]|nr:hypothetical protein [Azospirillaceae bacterium]